MTTSTSTVAHPDELSPAQLAVLRLVAAGDNDREIARTLGISPRTVKNHCSMLYARLPLGYVGNLRVAAALWYVRRRGETGDGRGCPAPSDNPDSCAPGVRPSMLPRDAGVGEG